MLGGGTLILEGVFMRLDKYLKVSRLIKRRTVANEACDNGLVTVNGKPARASYDVKAGDQISLRFGVRTVTVEVLSVQETVKQADAATLYREIGR
jgi:ribosomal 50S subunit-recycling heat shock protein